jgi:caffeoyl-CoA O-methyltransferase
MADNTVVPDALAEYVRDHSTGLDPVAQDLLIETQANLSADAKMQVAPDQAILLGMFTRLVGARQALEIGTFTGMSSLAIARNLAPGGFLTCLDISDEFTSVARRYWKRAEVSDRIELRIGDAAQLVTELPDEPYLDLVFIDADKSAYPLYWDALVPRVRPGGLLLADNVLWKGMVTDPPEDDPDPRAMAAFNQKVRGDDRVDVVILPVADGITMAVRR